MRHFGVTFILVAQLLEIAREVGAFASEGAQMFILASGLSMRGTGQAIVQAAGGYVSTLDSALLRYTYRMCAILRLLPRSLAI